MIKVHLCCGKRDFGDDWVSIDGSREYSHIKYHDIINLPFEDNTVDLMYCAHGIEYFDREEIVPILKGWWKKLKPGGILRLAVPDFERMISLYYLYRNNLGHDHPLYSNIETYLGPLYGKMRMNEGFIYHKTAYDKRSLTNLLKNTGFKEVREWDWRLIDHGIFDDHSQAYLPKMDKENGTLISLNLEAIK